MLEILKHNSRKEYVPFPESRAFQILLPHATPLKSSTLFKFDESWCLSVQTGAIALVSVVDVVLILRKWAEGQ
jgi:hypothetical protein